MRNPAVILSFCLLSLAGCHGKPANPRYVRTGMYYIVDSGGGVRMKIVGSTEDYYLSGIPFASVDNVSRCTVHNGMQTGDSYLELQFDEKGQKDLMLGTSNPSHPRIALVIANRLLYVVDQYDRIGTGIMKVGVNGYSDKEIERMREAIENKQ